MSSLFATIQAAEEFVRLGNNNAAADACSFAQDIISQHWPKKENTLRQYAVFRLKTAYCGVMTASEILYTKRRLWKDRHFAGRVGKIAKSASRRLPKY